MPPANILYATFDHPLLRLVGLDIARLWREFEPAKEGPEYLFLDEIQITKDWQTWIKHQVDFGKQRRIAVTGSTTPLIRDGQESGVGAPLDPAGRCGDCGFETVRGRRQRGGYRREGDS